MSKSVVVSIPHRLGREEALRRIKSGLTSARRDHSKLVTISQEVWTGDRVAFQCSAFGQNAAGIIDVADDHLRLEVMLPWLLSKIAEKIVPQIRKEAVLMLEKK